MSVFDRLERRWGWLAFPGFLRYYAMFHILVFVLQLFRPDIAEILAFDREKILAGEVWRVATMFFASSQFGDPRNLLSIMLLFFAISVIFVVSDGLEAAWGSFKSSLFYYTGILLTLVANFAYPIAIPFSGMLFYASAFLAFCTIFPRAELLMFFVIPVQVRFLGMLTALGIIAFVGKQPAFLWFVLLALANYLIWAGIPTLRGTMRVIESGNRRSRFNSSKTPASEAFHTCIICQKTDVSDPHTEFRIGRDGEEYCDEHLPE